MSKASEATGMDISFVIPVFNEEDNLEPLMAEIAKTMQGVGRSYEVLFVNDKSTDTSLDVLRKLTETYPGIRILNHRINSGESAAQATGFEQARGELIITMDADQQNNPADIPDMLAAMKDDIDAVCGVRRKREDTRIKKISSKLANGFRNSITGDKISDAGCTYRVLRRSALHDVLVFNGMHRFLPTMLRLQGYRVIEVPVTERPRTRGESKYGLNNRVWRGIADCFAMRWYRRRCLNGRRYAATDDKY
ncbi:MAG: glycosyltransferase [Spartobacteria bacterium]|nr:glycosyltransferase [Spartobacteria bacterium]